MLDGFSERDGKEKEQSWEEKIAKPEQYLKQGI
jgi:hypothetical protein